MQIPNGTIVTYTGTWSLGLHLISADQFLSDVGGHLIDDGLTILNSQINGAFLASLEIGPLTVVLTVLNQQGQELDDTDFMASMTDAVHMSGGTIVSQSITGLTGASSGGSSSAQTIPTGQPGQVAGGPGTAKTFACGDPSWSFFDSPGTWFQCLASKGLSTLGLVFIGLMVGIVLIVTAQKRPGSPL